MKKFKNYAELKSWFEEQIKNGLLPEKLNGKDKYYSDVTFTIKSFINTIEQAKITHGTNISKSRVATASKNNLLTLYKDLQNVENWDKDYGGS